MSEFLNFPVHRFFREDDALKIRAFIDAQLPDFRAKPIADLWHYTDANGLLGILQSRSIWATHISCLNDRLEQRLLNSLVEKATLELAKGNTNECLSPLFAVAKELFCGADFERTTHFIACFSESFDDLGQWRGYGGGENGYAIGFRVNDLLEATRVRGVNTGLMPLSYDPTVHKRLADRIITLAREMFLAGLSRDDLDPLLWARELLIELSSSLDIFACLMKNPVFAAEREHRIVTHLSQNDYRQLEFRQRRSLLARDLPLRLTLGEQDQERLLPITRILIGPGPAQRVSQLSVVSLLRKYGYPDSVQIEVSQIPYRVP